VFSALLDTCVLVPSRARDVLLEVASTGAYRPLWSSEILAELDRTLRLLLGKREVSPEETDVYLTRLFRQMETAFPDALVTGWESLAETVQLPDPDDRHVVAAARVGRADVIAESSPSLIRRPRNVWFMYAGRTSRMFSARYSAGSSL
jgi:hypothetical protein